LWGSFGPSWLAARLDIMASKPFLDTNKLDSTSFYETFRKYDKDGELTGQECNIFFCMVFDVC